MDTSHHQVPVEGIAVDAALAPLLTELWRRGLRTNFSCQGDWSGPDYTLGEGSKGDGLGPNQWSPEREDVDNASYILFAEFSDATYFLWETMRLLLSATGPDDRPLMDAQLRLEPSDPDPEHGGGLRGTVRFHAALLESISGLWLSGA